jgi:hypothetical protein
MPDGEQWEFGATAAQVLLARAWLRGETRPGAPLVEQWKVVLSDDSSDGASRRPGATEWNAAASKLAGDFLLRKHLRNLTDSTEAIALKSSPSVKVELVAAAIRSLAGEGRFAPFPAIPPEQPDKTKWLTGLATSAAYSQSTLMELPAREVARLRGLATWVLDVAGSTGFAVYIARAASAFGTVRQDLPNHAANDLSDWFREYGRRQALLKPGPGSDYERLQDFLAARSWETLPDEAPIPALLDYAIQAPAEQLEGIHGLVKDTDALVSALVDYLEQHENTGSDTKDAAAVVEFGQTITMKAAQLKALL